MLRRLALVDVRPPLTRVDDPEDGRSQRDDARDADGDEQQSARDQRAREAGHGVAVARARARAAYLLGKRLSLLLVLPALRRRRRSSPDAEVADSRPAAAGVVSLRLGAATSLPARPAVSRAAAPAAAVPRGPVPGPRARAEGIRARQPRRPRTPGRSSPSSSAAPCPRARSGGRLPPRACAGSSPGRPRFSAIHSRAKSPDWISPRISFIAARVSSPITRLPRVRSPYSAVLEIE